MAGSQGQLYSQSKMEKKLLFAGIVFHLLFLFCSFFCFSWVSSICARSCAVFNMQAIGHRPAASSFGDHAGDWDCSGRSGTWERDTVSAPHNRNLPLRTKY